MQLEAVQVAGTVRDVLGAAANDLSGRHLPSAVQVSEVLNDCAARPAQSSSGLPGYRYGVSPGHRPTQTGGRLATNAATPSRKSALP